MSDRFNYSDEDLAGITITRKPRVKYANGTFISKFDENQARDERGRFSTDGGGDALDQNEALQKIWRDGVERVIGAEPGRVAESIKGVPQELKAAVSQHIAEKLSEFDAKQLMGPLVHPEEIRGVAEIALRSSENVVGLENIDFVRLDERGNLLNFSAMALPHEVGMVPSEITTNEALSLLASSQYANDGFVLAGTPEAEEMVRSAAVSDLVAQWAETSNNSSPLSLAIQEVAAETFNTKDSMPWPSSEKTLGAISDLKEEHGDVLKAFVAAQYDATQEYLKSEGITSIELFRGMSVSEEQYAIIRANDEGSHELSTRPLTSWSTDGGQAIAFGDGPRGVLLQATIPADRIFSLPLTGIGCFTEQEVVVLGGKDTVIASRVGGLNK